MAEMKIIEKSGNRVSIKCAFCDGTGKDPFGLLSVLSTCQVCRGSGQVWVTEPFIKCAFCKGSGVQPSRRVTCTVCGGKGVVAAPAQEQREICPECGGSGQSHSHWNVPCLKCKGKGFITLKAREAQ